MRKPGSRQQGSPGNEPQSPRGPPVSFEQFSKDEGFKKSQKAAGLSYEEKVQSYLTEQPYTNVTVATAGEEAAIEDFPITPMGGPQDEEPPPLQEMEFNKSEVTNTFRVT